MITTVKASIAVSADGAWALLPARSLSVIADDTDTLDPQELRDRLRKAEHKNAILKRLKFAAKSEAYNAEQKSLLEETLDTDLAAVAAEIEALQTARTSPAEKQQSKREKLPTNLPRREIHHEPEKTTGRSREAGLPAGRVHGRAPHPRQVGLQVLREDHPSAGASSRHRQGGARRRPAGAGAGGQVPGPPLRMPSRIHSPIPISKISGRTGPRNKGAISPRTRPALAASNRPRGAAGS